MDYDSHIAEIAAKVGESVDRVTEAYDSFLNADYTPEESLILAEASFIWHNLKQNAQIDRK